MFDQRAFAAYPTLHAAIVICLSELTLSYSIVSANFPAFRRLTSDIRTNFGGFNTKGTHSTMGARSVEPGSGRELSDIYRGARGNDANSVCRINEFEGSEERII